MRAGHADGARKKKKSTKTTKRRLFYGKTIHMFMYMLLYRAI